MERRYNKRSLEDIVQKRLDEILKPQYFTNVEQQFQYLKICEHQAALEPFETTKQIRQKNYICVIKKYRKKRKKKASQISKQKNNSRQDRIKMKPNNGTKKYY